MGYDKLSKDRQRRERDKLKRQEKRWARKSGPVEVRFVCPVCGGPHSRAEHPLKAQKPPATGTGGFNEG